jgi:hypothetical protein
MTTAATPMPTPTPGAPHAGVVHDKINKGPHKIGIFIFVGLFAIGIVYSLAHLISDVSHVHHLQPSSRGL